jgi:hypothetical protein
MEWQLSAWRYVRWMWRCMPYKLLGLQSVSRKYVNRLRSEDVGFRDVDILSFSILNCLFAFFQVDNLYLSKKFMRVLFIASLPTLSALIKNSVWVGCGGTCLESALRQEDCEFKTSLGYVVRPCLKRIRKKKKT